MFASQRSLETQLWLSDAAIRLLCVLALDRFADFISDQVFDINLCYTPIMLDEANKQPNRI